MKAKTARAIVLLAIVAKLALLLVLTLRRPGSFTYTDTETYLGPARALLSAGRFSVAPDRPAEPEIVRTPGYPIVVAAVFRVVGEKPWALSALGACASAATALLLLRGLAGTLSTRAAAWAATLLTIDAGSFLRSLDVLSETVFTLLFVVALWTFLVAVRDGTARVAALSGGLLGFATLMRPIALYLGPLAIVGFLLLLRRSGFVGKRAVALAGAFALPLAFLVGGWIVRNECVAGFPSLAPVAGHQLLHRRAAAVLAAAEGRPLVETQDRLGIREAFFRFRGGTEAEMFGGRRYVDAFPETSALPLPALDRRWAHEAREIFRSHPVLTIGMFARGALELLLSPPPLVVFAHWGLYDPSPGLVALWENHRAWEFGKRLLHEHPLLFAVSAACVAQLLVVSFLALLGGRVAFRRAAPGGWALAVSLVYFVAVSASTDAIDDRYRIPVMPLLAAFAGLALARQPSPAETPFRNNDGA